MLKPIIGHFVRLRAVLPPLKRRWANGLALREAERLRLNRVPSNAPAKRRKLRRVASGPKFAQRGGLTTGRGHQNRQGPAATDGRFAAPRRGQGRSDAEPAWRACHCASTCVDLRQQKGEMRASEHQHIGAAQPAAVPTWRHGRAGCNPAPYSTSDTQSGLGCSITCDRGQSDRDQAGEQTLERLSGWPAPDDAAACMRRRRV